MALAEIRNVEKAYAGRAVLKGISLDLQKGERIGLVGANGSGKTTLLRLIARAEQPDAGSVAVARACKLAYVPQIPDLDPQETLHHQVSLVFEEVHELERQLHAAAEELGRCPAGPLHDAAMQRYARLEAEFQHMAGYDIERRVESVLDQLGLAQRDMDTPVKLLSGGQKSRAQLARLLLEGPDLMLLDEPTNHLDLPMLDWLEETIAGMPEVAMVVVSHDRYFLDSVCDEILDLVDGQIEQYPANYSGYTALKEQRLLARQRQYEQQQAYIAKQEEYIRRFGAGQRAMQARGRKTRLERLKAGAWGGLVSKVQSHRRNVTLNLEVSRPSGIDVVKIQDLSKSYPDKPLFQHLDLHLTRGTRIGIIGPNGSGKSTLLNILATDHGQPPDGQAVLPDGGAIKWGHHVTLQYLRQEHQTLHLENTVLEELQSARITATRQELHDLAGLLLFSGDAVDQKVATLSGGQRARVALGKLLLNPANTLFLDEPTNHLDMPTCEVLEEALDSYDGTLVIVSHDRYFLDQVCDFVLALNPLHLPAGSPGVGGAHGGHWKLYKGAYTEYLAAVAREKAQVAAQRNGERRARAAAEARAAREEARRRKDRHPPAGPSRKLPHKFARLSLDQVERQIAALEATISTLEESFGDPRIASHPPAMKELQSKYAQVKRDLEEHMAAWEIMAQ